jgi:hypothetical protein
MLAATEAWPEPSAEFSLLFSSVVDSERITWPSGRTSLPAW